MVAGIATTVGTNSDTKWSIVRSMRYYKSLMLRPMLVGLMLFVCSVQAVGELETIKRGIVYNSAENCWVDRTMFRTVPVQFEILSWAGI